MIERKKERKEGIKVVNNGWNVLRRSVKLEEFNRATIGPPIVAVGEFIRV